MGSPEMDGLQSLAAAVKFNFLEIKGVRGNEVISILIADDEEDIIALVKKLIVYPHVTVVGEAKNGTDAYAQILEKKPDLVITDISMPGMSGMEVIEKVKLTCPDINFVVISGYRDFEYAQSALRFGVSDYLLKPIKKTELNEILEKVDLRFQSKNQLLEQVDLMQKNIDESRKLIRKNYVQQILHSIGKEQLKIPEIEGDPVFVFGKGSFQCLLIKLDEGHMAAGENSIQALLQEVGEAVRKEAVLCCQEAEFFLMENRVYFLLNYMENISEEDITQLYKSCEKLLKEINYKFGFIRVTAGVSLRMRSEDEMRKAYKQVEFAVRGRLENQINTFFYFDPEREAAYQNTFCFKTWAAEKKLRSIIERLEEREITGAFLMCWERFVVQKKIPGAVFGVAQEFVDFMHRTLQEIITSDMTSFAEYDAIYKKMDNCSEMGQMKELMLRYIQKLTAWCSQATKDKAAKPVRMAKAYVENHYAEQVTLEDVARHICLSPTYFSGLFKAETGQGFLNYLQSVRIGEGKRLLRETSISIGEIAGMVGYADVKYFSKLFVKETGIKPSAYRKFYSRSGD